MIWDDLGEIPRLRRHRQRDSRIKMRIRTTTKVRNQNPAQHRKSPRGRNHKPAAVLRLGALEQNSGNHAVTQQYQNQSSHELTKEGRSHPCSLTSLKLLLFIPHNQNTFQNKRHPDDRREEGSLRSTGLNHRPKILTRKLKQPDTSSQTSENSPPQPQSNRAPTPTLQP